MIGSYSFIRPIGSGTYGDVSLVMKGDTYYAMKRVSLIDMASTMVEVSLLSQMSHPCIMKPIEYLFEDDTINMVMKWVSGSLQDNMEGIDVRIFLWQMLGALDYMHENGIIHRDLKPGNIMIDRSDYPVIIDMGLAHYSPVGSTNMSYYVQTMGYKAPEVLAGEPYGTAIDIFSLGVIAYRMVAGKHPFNPYSDEIDQSDIDIAMDKIAHSEHADIIEKMLIVDQEHRPSAYTLMKDIYFDGLGYHLPDIISFREQEYGPTPSVMEENRVIEFIKMFKIKPIVVDYVTDLIKNTNLEVVTRWMVICLMAVISKMNDSSYSDVVNILSERVSYNENRGNELYSLLVSLDMSIF